MNSLAVIVRILIDCYFFHQFLDRLYFEADKGGKHIVSKAPYNFAFHNITPGLYNRLVPHGKCFTQTTADQ